MKLTRYSFIGILLTVFAVTIFVWMVRIQVGVIQVQAASKKEEQQQAVLNVINPDRGNIYDRWGKLLAGNKVVYELNLNLDAIVNEDTLAKDLKELVGVDYKQTINSVDTLKYRYITLTDFVEASTIAEFEARMKQYDAIVPERGSKERRPSLSGLEWTPHLVRFYPENTLGSNVLGFYAYKDRDQAGRILVLKKNMTRS